MDVRGIRMARDDVSPLRIAMLKCEHCASHNVRWFTPRSYAGRAAVLLCMTCRRLTISTSRSAPPAEASKAA
jgi:hypothetical protein